MSQGEAARALKWEKIKFKPGMCYFPCSRKLSEIIEAGPTIFIWTFTIWNWAFRCPVVILLTRSNLIPLSRKSPPKKNFLIFSLSKKFPIFFFRTFFQNLFGLQEFFRIFARKLKINLTFLWFRSFSTIFCGIIFCYFLDLYKKKLSKHLCDDEKLTNYLFDNKKLSNYFFGKTNFPWLQKNLKNLFIKKFRKN